MSIKELLELLNTFEEKGETPEFFLEVLGEFFDEKKTPLPPKPRVRGAVWKGGGVKVFGYVGAIEEMTRLGVVDDLTHVGGSSGGSIFAMLFALGFSGEQIMAMGEHLDMRDLTDVRQSSLGDYVASSTLGKFVGGSLGQGYIFSGEHIRDFVAGMLEHALGSSDATFRDLHEARKHNPTLKDLYLVATKLRTQDSENTETIFGFDRHPDVRIIDAFCASLALPMVYKPVEVFKKDGTSIGFFTDGGIYDNFPIQLFDEPVFCESHYPLQSLRYQNLKSYHYNPSTMGFTLITELDELNEAMTPFTPRLKELRGHSSPAHQADPTPPVWYKGDLIRAIIANTFGKLTVEDETLKYHTHPEGIVQIYVEGVDMIEFHLSGEKFERLVTSGRMAYRLWYERFYHPTATFEGEYNHHPKLSLAQQQRKANNYLDYLQDKLTESIFDFMDELRRRRTESLTELIKNARLRFNAYRLTRDLAKIERLENSAVAHEILGKAWKQAAQDYATQQGDRVAVRTYLDRFAQRDLCLQWLKKLAVLNHEFEYEKFQRIIKAQTSRLLYYCFEARESLLHTVAAKAPWHLTFLFEQIQDYLSLRYQSGRVLDMDFKTLLNQVPNPPLLHAANQYFGLEAIELCLNHGVSILTRDSIGRTAFHDVIDRHDLDKFRYYLSCMRQQHVYRKYLTFGFQQLPIMFYLCQPAHQDFLIRILAHLPKEDLVWLSQADSHITDVQGNSLLEYASILRIDVWANLAQVLTQGKTNPQFTQCQANRQRHQRQHQEKLTVLLDELISDNSFNVETLNQADSKLLLALLVAEANPLIMLCLKQGAAEFGMALLDKIKAHGDGQVLKGLAGYRVEGHTILEWAHHYQANWLVDFLEETRPILTDSPATLLFSDKSKSVNNRSEITENLQESLSNRMSQLTLSD